MDLNQNVYHVSRNTPNEWKIYSEHGNALIGTYPTKEKAIEEAEVLARTIAGGKVIVHNAEDDSVEREIDAA